MGLAAVEVIGTEKQGLGYCLIVNGKIWPLKINDPGTITFERNKLDATHSKTLDFKQSKYEELAEPLEQDLTCFFDPTLEEGFDIVRTAGAKLEREIYLAFPRIPLKVGEATRENAFIYLPAGQIAGNSIAMPLDNFMTQEVNVNGGTQNPTIKKERAVTATMAPATDIVLTDIKTAAIAAGDIIAKLTTDIANEEDVSLFFGLTGADADKVELDGFYVKALVPMTLTGSDSGDAAYQFSVTTSNMVGFDENIGALQYTEALTFTVTA